MARKVKLTLAGFSLKPGTERTSRRYINKYGVEISRRQFVKLAQRQKITPKPPKIRETAKQHRAKLYANYVNRQTWKAGGLSRDYISRDEAMQMPEFVYYDSLVGSGYADDRYQAEEFWDDLEDIYAAHDWGETP